MNRAQLVSNAIARDIETMRDSAPEIETLLDAALDEVFGGKPGEFMTDFDSRR